MKFSLTLFCVFFMSLAFGQILRPDAPAGGEPTRGSNYSDRTSIGGGSYSDQSNDLNLPRRRGHWPSSGSNYSDNAKDQETTATGIALDAPWKKRLNAFALKNVVHAAWGYSHSERNFHVAKAIAQDEGVYVDEDILFAVSFLHDLGGLKAYEKPGVDHGVRSAQLAGPLLRSFGFPEGKINSVKEAIVGHVYDRPGPSSELAWAFRDADLLDFLGPMGITRLLAANHELSKEGSIKVSIEIAKNFMNSLPNKLYFPTSKRIGASKNSMAKRFLDNLKKESLGGLAY